MPESDQNSQLKSDFIGIAKATGGLLEPITNLPNHHHHSKAEESLMLAMHWLDQAAQFLHITDPEEKKAAPQKLRVTLPVHEKLEQIKRYVDGSMAMTRHLLVHVQVERSHLLFYNALNCAHNELVTCSFWLDRAATFHRMKHISRNGKF